ncbi:MAG: ATP synthase F1 subunit delta [Ruminiclostridium sp.]|nr:ATP synthase F1 subunit delta [Ruminiclostridium sp.]
MTGIVEKNYGDALFELILEENAGMLKTVQGELASVGEILEQVPEFIKLSKTPTVSAEEKMSLIKDAFEGRVSDYTYRFLMILAENGRLEFFGKINRYFSSRCNERLGIAEITVVTTAPLSEELKAKIKLKMTQVTGKTITLKEEIDSSLIGGIVLKYGSKSFDGSVKARLDALKAEIGSVIC